MAKLKVRRERQEQWLWERDSLPTPEEERRRYLLQQHQRAGFDPPLTEIWSGKSLNDLLLAWYRLIELAPQPAKGIVYNPVEAESRKKAREEWRKKLAPGKVPPLSVPQGDESGIT